MFRTRLHLLFLLSGVVIVIVLGIHMAVQILGSILVNGDPDPTSWSSMISRSTQVPWVVIYIVLLAFVLFHAFYGLRGIIQELTISTAVMRVINWSFTVGGIIIFIWGSYVLLYMMSS